MTDRKGTVHSARMRQVPEGGAGMSDYNYANFPLDLEMPTFDAWMGGVRAGEKAPDGVLTDAASGDAVRLSDVWKRGTLVIEFGSLT